MKKWISLFLILLMITPAFAEDLSAMTDDELRNLRTQIDIELSERAAHNEERNIIIENDDILVYSTGKGSDWSNGFHLSVVFQNKSSTKIGLAFDYVIINGWQFEVYDSSGAIEPGAKTKMDLTLDYATAELNSVTDITDLTIKLYTYTESYERTEYGSVHFTPVW